MHDCKIYWGPHLSEKKTATISQLIGATFILMVTWLILSGYFKTLLLSLGLFSVILSLWLANRTGYFIHALSLRVMLRLPALWWWVFLEVVKSSIEVSKIILSPSLPIQPELVEFKTAEEADSGKVILANSITLSPGTVTIDMHKGSLLVHCLTKSSADSLRTREVEERTAKLGID